MSNFKDSFATGTPVSSSEMNQNFSRLNGLFKYENLTSQVDGIVTQFSTGFNYVAGNIIVFVDGIAALPATDIQEDGTNLFTTLFANPLESGATVTVFYIREF